MAKYFILFLTVLTTACDPSRVTQIPQPPTERVIMFSNEGRIIQQWETDGYVAFNEGQYIFTDKETGHYFRITGNVIIERK